MQKSCRQCSAEFEITEDDLAFYDKVSPVFNGKKEQIPPPTLCVACREQRRLAFRNERTLYHRKCDLTGKQMISMYSPQSAYTVYDQAVWWSDAWDPLRYGRDVDFSRPFFDQFADLLLAVPRISLINKEHENSEFCNFCFQNKNSYLLFTSADCEDSYYCNRALGKDLCDCSNIEQSERCYEVLDSTHCYNCQYLQNCSNCSDCSLGYNLRGCRNCFACYSLANAEYCIGNVRHEKAEYERLVAEMRRNLSEVRARYEEQKRSLPRRFMNGIGNEGCSGNNVLHSKNAKACYEVMNLEDCAHVANATFLKDSRDVDNDDHSELAYENVGADSNYRQLFTDISWFNKELLYCSLCFHSESLFGCCGLKRQKYCILNKQYTKEAYEALAPRIVAHMRQAGEWGEFFPARISPFAYNESMAQEYFPLSREQAASLGSRWHDDGERKEQYLGPRYEPPDDIAEVSDDITKQILTCEITGKPYRIIPQELKFYREMNIPIPRRCPDQRHADRLALRNPRRLWHRQCARCSKAIETTYAPERLEIVYCEDCYLSTVS